jgi:folylpolyglutamate synthase/dihydropteroate synthase
LKGLSPADATVKDAKAYLAQLKRTGNSKCIRIHASAALRFFFERVRRLNWEPVPPAGAQVLRHDPPAILDAAHNPAGARALRNTLHELFRDRPLGLVVGMSHDKDLAQFMQVLAPAARRLWTVPLDNQRSADPQTLADYARAAGKDATPSTLAAAVPTALAWAADSHAAVCIAGSVYLAGEVLRRRTELHLDTPPPT